MQTARSLSAFGLAATAPLVLFAAPQVVHAQSPTLATANAKTIQVTAKLYGYLPQPVPLGADGKPDQTKMKAPELTQLAPIRIEYAKPGNIRAEEALPGPADAANPSFSTSSVFVADGKILYNYIPRAKSYVKNDAPEDGKPFTGRTRAGSAAAELVNLVTGRGQTPFTPAPDETIDGKALKVYTRTVPTPPSMKMTRTVKLWVDPATQLPVRVSSFSEREGKINELSRVEYSDWKLNAALPTDRFVWTPPAGIEEYKEPVRPELLTPGTIAPDFTVAKWGGGDLKLSDYKGKVVILDFWATWCGPCQKSMPHVEQVYKAVKGQDVVVLGVCVWDEKAKYDDWMPKNQDKYTFTFAFDPAGRGADNIASSKYKVSGIPTTYIIDKEGKVAAALVGFNPEGDTRIEESLAKLGVTVKDTPKQAANLP